MEQEHETTEFHAFCIRTQFLFNLDRASMLGPRHTSCLSLVVSFRSAWQVVEFAVQCIAPHASHDATEIELCVSMRAWT
eukprot:215231-Pelagomonas_calceolata.AAC.6